MRRYKPDIIILLTLLVGIGVLATTAAQAAQPPGVAGVVTLSGGSAHTGDKCGLLCRLFGGSASEDDASSPQAGAAVGDYPVNPAFGRLGASGDSGLHYKIPMVTSAGNGGIDFNLRLANHRTPSVMLDPYISLSFSGHW